MVSLEEINQPRFSLSQARKRYNVIQSSFEQYLNDVKEYIDNYLHSNYVNQGKEMNELNIKALQCHPEGMNYFYGIIQGYLQDHPYLGDIPLPYHSIEDAIFHELKGYSSLSEWLFKEQWANSANAQIIGQRIFASVQGEYQLLNYQFRSLDKVEKIIRNLETNDHHKQLSLDHPSAEFKMNDPLWPGRFIRVQIINSPRVWEGFTTITFRRQLVEFLTFEEQAGTGSIPYETVELFQYFADTYQSTVVAGPVDSGKTTFANTLIGERCKNSKKPLGIPMIEEHPESILPKLFLNHRFIPIIASENDYKEIRREVLRQDPDFVFIPEIRTYEWELFMFLAKKGKEGNTSSFHTDHPEDTPYQIAQALNHTNFEGTIGEAASALRTFIVMKPEANGKKKVASLSEISFDQDKNTVVSTDWMRWDQQKKEYKYYPIISERIWNKMVNNNEKAAVLFRDKLEGLAKKSPMSKDEAQRYSLATKLTLSR